MFTLFHLTIWSMIEFGLVCYLILLFCEFATKKKFLFGHYFVKGRKPLTALLIFLLIVVLVPPLSWVLAVIALAWSLISTAIDDKPQDA